MADKKNKEIRVLVYILILAIIFCVSYFLVFPKLKEVKKTRAEYLTYSKLLKEKESSLQEFNNVAAIYKERNSDFKKIDQSVLDETNDKVFLLVQFEVLASINNMTMQSFSFGQIAAGDGNLGVLPVNLTVKGKYSDFKDYLDSIAQNLPLMEVESIQFSPSGEKSKLYTFILVINIYSKDVPRAQNQGGNTEAQSTSPEATASPTTSPSPTQSPSQVTP